MDHNGKRPWEAVRAFFENKIFIETLGKIIMGSDSGKRCVSFVKIKRSLTLGGGGGNHGKRPW